MLKNNTKIDEHVWIPKAKNMMLVLSSTRFHLTAIKSVRLPLSPACLKSALQTNSEKELPDWKWDCITRSIVVTVKELSNMAKGSYFPSSRSPKCINERIFSDIRSRISVNLITHPTESFFHINRSIEAISYLLRNDYLKFEESLLTP